MNIARIKPSTSINDYWSHAEIREIFGANRFLV